MGIVAITVNMPHGLSASALTTTGCPFKDIGEFFDVHEVFAGYEVPLVNLCFEFEKVGFEETGICNVLEGVFDACGCIKGCEDHFIQTDGAIYKRFMT